MVRVKCVRECRGTGWYGSSAFESAGVRDGTGQVRLRVQLVRVKCVRECRCTGWYGSSAFESAAGTGWYGSSAFESAGVRDGTGQVRSRVQVYGMVRVKCV